MHKTSSEQGETPLMVRNQSQKSLIIKRQETFNLTGKTAYDTCISSDYFILGIWKHRIRLFPLLIPSHTFSMLQLCGRDSWGQILLGIT